MRHHLSIDLETYCSLPIAKTGAYRYIQNPDFEIMLMAYSLDGGPVEIIDLAQREIIPDWLLDALESPEYIKHAYNAAFEWYSLSKLRGHLLPINQWRDTMLHSLYCGLSASLSSAGKAIGLSEEKQKMTTGAALIRYFCVPCNPTKSNGGRTRNLPEHAPSKWAQFKEYCKGDVRTEMEIDRVLARFPVPESVEKQWQTDLAINARGVAVDMALVSGALEIDAATREQVLSEVKAITGLSNPNSVQQLTVWLAQNAGLSVTDLRKSTVEALLESKTLSNTARKILAARQELSKTSTKKYAAINSAVCSDGRVRGLLQFYGANRTGRWAGRLVQVQNLPRTYIGQLPLAREAVRQRQADKLRLLYGSIPDTLSQLIRTSFIAANGNRLVDVDFSAIEARVISWLANERWRQEVFRTHGRIYEASASQMFGVPIDRIKKGFPEYSLRQKGKVAELALGYQGGTNALIAMGALKMGIPEEDLPDIVSRWREANKNIVDLWYQTEKAATAAIQTGAPTNLRGLVFARELDVEHGLDFLTIMLPSKRKLYYAGPQIGENRWGRPSISYRGVNQTTRQWSQLETYGGKLVENIVQAIARDCLALAIERLEDAGYPIVFHIHDEVVIDCPVNPNTYPEVLKIMTKPIPWAEGLQLNGDGWVGDFFRKD